MSIKVGRQMFATQIYKYHLAGWHLGRHSRAASLSNLPIKSAGLLHANTPHKQKPALLPSQTTEAKHLLNYECPPLL